MLPVGYLSGIVQLQVYSSGVNFGQLVIKIRKMYAVIEGEGQNEKTKRDLGNPGESGYQKIEEKRVF